MVGVGAGGLALRQFQPSIAPPAPNNPSQVSDTVAAAYQVQQQQQHPQHIAPPRCSSPCPRPRPLLLHCITSMEEFKQAHAHFVKLGLDRERGGVGGGDLLSACALSDWGSLVYARSIFDGLDERGAFHYNTMIRAYAASSDPDAALRLYREMAERGVEPDGFTFPFALKACALLSAAGEGAQLHASAFKSGFGSDAYAQNALINLYGKCGEVELSRKVFQQLGSNRTVASWSAALAAHARAGLWAGCLRLFSSMTTAPGGARPDESSIVSALSSCARLGALRAGRSIHSSLERNFTGLNVAVRTALLDMYMKCGCPEKGMLVFGSMRGGDKNAWAYGVLISGLAAHGAGEKAVEAFEDMSRDGIEPDDAVFVGVLSACGRAGLVEEGLRCFDRMRTGRPRVEPNAQHYGCVVDLLGRAGRLDDALTLIRDMPVGLPTDVAWRSLLSACKVHGNLELADRAMRNLVELSCAKAGDYVILSNMYSKMRRWDDAARVRTEMADLGLSQVAGVSRVEVKGRVYTFVSQDRSHPCSDGVYEMLYQMEWQLRFEGYEPDTSEVSLLGADDDDDDEEKERQKLQVVCRQSQKLAIAFALLNTGQGEPIRVFANLRMSSECHAYTKLISKIFDRDIVVRDRNRFHRFRQGSCSCQDFW